MWYDNEAHKSLTYGECYVITCTFTFPVIHTAYILNNFPEGNDMV